MPTRILCIIAISLAISAGCGRKKARVTSIPATAGSSGRKTTPAIPVPVGYVEMGNASWYGVPYHGRQAADGEIYDMETLVAAHRTMPFQTWVRVTLLSTNKAVDVRIIDRGPFVGGRVIDLSHAAAKEIGLLVPGVGPVRIEVIRTPDRPEPAVFAVQVGLFRQEENADRLVLRMADVYGSAKKVARPGNETMWRVLAGKVNTPEEAEALAARIRHEQNVPEAFVVRIDP